ncbi:MAG: SDR family NAD(P)-dependent oxidoreductase [Intrasporangium sp.]|uniref:SDR family NAD(P)-dependent oxidoreductase n=1 Tax=Intrasporangium sp. TaxID=1925024 RepID=UPI002648CBF5|nr:SDR family NAD(P)-dependent oxidoreductase [Intrasporangium sp.]MDN5797378.1 SDR family NAD(P)-dependent oxidoreductase [Intrasporangium sp.]
MTHLAGAYAVVTGGSSGIGAATARRLASEGARVDVVGRNAERLRAVAAQTGGEAVRVDLTDAAARRDLACRLRDDPPDVLVHNAGVGLVGEAWADGQADGFAGLIETNARAPIELTAAVLPAMFGRGSGHLVFVGSIAGALGVAHESTYAASKAAIMTYAAGLASEVRARGVRVTVVIPGVVDTPFFERRGAAYHRRFPRPVSAELVARRLVEGVRQDRDLVVVPRWLRVPMVMRALAPGTYMRLASRWG